jgi:hypothetical protein
MLSVVDLYADVITYRELWRAEEVVVGYFDIDLCIYLPYRIFDQNCACIYQLSPA